MFDEQGYSCLLFDFSEHGVRYSRTKYFILSTHAQNLMISQLCKVVEVDEALVMV